MFLWGYVDRCPSLLYDVYLWSIYFLALFIYWLKPSIGKRRKQSCTPNMYVYIYIYIYMHIHIFYFQLIVHTISSFEKKYKYIIIMFRLSISIHHVEESVLSRKRGPKQRVVWWFRKPCRATPGSIDASRAMRILAA